MSGITRQSEQYGIFDNTPRPEHVAREVAPESVIREYTRGPAIGGGMLNPRQAKKTWCPDCRAIVPDSHEHSDEDDDEDSQKKAYRQGVNVSGMDPESHAYATEDPYGPGPGRHYNPYAGWEPSDYDERRREAVGEDDESGYNWGPETPYDPGSEPGPHPDFHGDRPYPFGTPIYNPGSRLGFNRQANPLAPLPPEQVEHALFHKWMDEHPQLQDMAEHALFHDWMDEHQNVGDRGYGEMKGASRIAQFDGDALGANLFGDVGDFDGYGEPFIPMRFRQRAPSAVSEMLGKVAAVPLLPGHRVGLPYRGGVIPGIVTHLHPNAQVGIRWHDGQHSLENPGDVIPL